MLQAANRLRKDADFKSVFKYGRSYSSPNLRLKVKSNRLAVSRFGVIVSLAVSKKASQRNLVRRRLKENLRVRIKNGQIKPSFDTVINVKPEILKLNYQELDQELAQALAKAGLLDSAAETASLVT